MTVYSVLLSSMIFLFVKAAVLVGFLMALMSVEALRSSRSSILKPSVQTCLRAVVDLQPGKFDEEVTNCKQPVLVDFYANWCGPCKLMAPIFSALSDEPDQQNVKFVKVDTDIHEEAVDQFNIQGLPLFGLFIEGKMVSAHSGALPMESLKEFIDRGLKLKV